jgi:hypothetical protein
VTNGYKVHLNAYNISFERIIIKDTTIKGNWSLANYATGGNLGDIVLESVNTDEITLRSTTENGAKSINLLNSVFGTISIDGKKDTAQFSSAHIKNCVFKNKLNIIRYMYGGIEIVGCTGIQDTEPSGQSQVDHFIYLQYYDDYDPISVTYRYVKLVDNVFINYVKILAIVNGDGSRKVENMILTNNVIKATSHVILLPFVPTSLIVSNNIIKKRTYTSATTAMFYFSNGGNTFVAGNNTFGDTQAKSLPSTGWTNTAYSNNVFEVVES